ncbi:hypothetical protein RFI_22921 [Reticulomyxa filosa]|uniref:Uncharacterized protein n=1 Tax=Reticulomyxa filosa TaxID=46433 RepID=X6MKB9_RETFI|nr:hypothetical protein RFI_22921 [Reticulomyxa filosa]|eukprot:ETO14448.1 hypothetical protein RFI_22921 [Reticulomyxa filosa]
MSKHHDKLDRKKDLSLFRQRFAWGLYECHVPFIFMRDLNEPLKTTFLFRQSSLIVLMRYLGEESFNNLRTFIFSWFTITDMPSLDAQNQRQTFDKLLNYVPLIASTDPSFDHLLSTKLYRLCVYLKIFFFKKNNKCIRKFRSEKMSGYEYGMFIAYSWLFISADNQLLRASFVGVVSLLLRVTVLLMKLIFSCMFIFQIGFRRRFF